jgi:hypothetical protein
MGPVRIGVGGHIEVAVGLPLRNQLLAQIDHLLECRAGESSAFLVEHREMRRAVPYCTLCSGRHLGKIIRQPSALAKFELKPKEQLSAAYGAIESQRKWAEVLDFELARLAEAGATVGPIAALSHRISKLEPERSSVHQILGGYGPGSIKARRDSARERRKA